MKKNFVALGLLLSAINILACTGVVVGKKATVDGSMIMARNEDFGSGANPKNFIVKQASVNNKGMFENPDTNFKIKMPEKTLKYYILPDADQDYGVFGEAGFNEYGVSTTTTLSASANDAILKFDPYVDGGITEADMASLILMSAKTAREGVEIIAKIIDEKGAGEGNVIMIADKNEMWYMEIYTGHQYAAVKVPDDKYAVVANAFYLGNVDLQSKDAIVSKDLINLPKKNNLLKEKDGKFHLAMTYRDPLSIYNQIRVWAGQNRLNPKDKLKYDDNYTFELFRKPDKKVALKDVMNILRDRYVGTEFEKNPKARPIGIDTNLESHIFQIKKDLPKEVGGIMWLAMGPVEHSVYIPYYGNITDTHESFKVSSGSYDNKSMYWAMKSLNVLSKTDRQMIGNSVMKYWSSLEDEFIKKQNENDKKLIEIYKKKGLNEANKFATNLSYENTDKVKKDADKMYMQILTFMSGKKESTPYKKPFEFKK